MNPTQTAQANPLDQLKDIHLPDAISWWPPALGWWIVAIVSISLITLLIVLLIRWWTNNAYKRQALKQLNSIKLQQNSAEDNIHALAELLRQTAIAADIPQVKKMHGQPWQALLQQHMLEEHAHLFAIARYQQAQLETPNEALYEPVEQWIKKHKKGGAI